MPGRPAAIRGAPLLATVVMDNPSDGTDDERDRTKPLHGGME